MAAFAIGVQSSSLKAAADALANADLKKAYSNALRDIAKPYGQYVLLAGAKELPKRGGLSYRVASSSVTTQASMLRTTVSLRSRQNYDLPAMDAGILRHPTFGHKPWNQQSIRSGIFSRPFKADLEQIVDALKAAGQKVLRSVAQSGG